MKINIQQEDKYTNIGFDGAVDLSSSSDARKSIIEVLEQNKNILIDLSLVSYIDSSGVASLVEGYQIAKKQSLKFLEGKSPPDFAAEDYEVNYIGRATIDDLTSLGRKQMALENWD